MSDSVDPVVCSLPGSSVHSISGKNTEVGCHALLQCVFLTQGLNLLLLHWQTGSLHLIWPGKPVLFDIFLHLSHWVSFIFISLGSLARCFSVDWLAFGILQSWWAFLSAPAWKGPLNLSYIWSVGSELYVLPWCSPCVGVHVLQLLLERKHTELSHSFTHKFHWALIKNSTKKKNMF